MQRLSMPVIVATLAVVCAIVYVEFGLDFRTPRSALAMRGALVTHNQLPPETLAAVTAGFKAKFGPDVQVWQGPVGINAKLDGKIVATAPAHTFFREALGITQVAEAPGVVSTFPFHVSPYEVRDSVHPLVVPMLRMRVARVFPAHGADFELDDFSIDRCRMLPPRELGLGLAGRVLDLSNSTTCVVTWKHLPFRRMLVGVVVAGGGSWIRPFAHGACRLLSDAWLASEQRQSAGERPDYLQCLLIDRPENKPFGSGVSTFAYEVRKDGSLARFGSDPVALEEAPLAPDPRVPTFRQRTEALRAEP